MTLNARQQRFVEEYCIDWNATQAATRAGYSVDTAYAIGSRLLTYVEVQNAIEAHKQELAAAAGISASMVLHHWREIAIADPNELISVRRINCRHCWGADHAYQWTQIEFETATAAAIRNGEELPDGIGGFGFAPYREPNPECPECGGIGYEHVLLKDTSKLSGPAKRLYAGVRKTKDGVQVLMRSQDDALQNIARYLGMLVDKKELSGPGGAPLLGDKTALTDEQLAALIAADDGKSSKQD